MNEIAKSYPELILGFITITAILGVLRFLLSQSLESKKVSFQKIELLNSVLKYNFNKTNSRQKFITEQAFSAVYGKRLSFNEIKALLNYKSPSEAILLFIKGRQFLNVSTTGKSFVLNKKYRKFTIFKIAFYPQDIKFLFLYFIFSFLTIFPIFIIYLIYTSNSWLDESFGLKNIFWFIMAVTMTLMFITLAIVNLLQQGKISQAFELAAKKANKLLKNSNI